MLNKKREIEKLENSLIIKKRKDLNLNQENSSENLIIHNEKNIEEKTENNIDIKNNENNIKIDENKEIKNLDYMICQICGFKIPKKEENDHYICHELQGDLEDKIILNKNDNNFNLSIEVNDNLNKDDILLIQQSKIPITYKLINQEKLPQNNKNCVICFCEFKNKDDLMILPCMHFFHENCINKWLLKEKKCPFCKTIFGKKNEENDESNQNINDNSIHNVFIENDSQSNNEDEEENEDEEDNEEENENEDKDKEENEDENK